MDDRPSGAASPAQLTRPYPNDDSNTEVPDSWAEAGSNSLGAWDFGDSRQNPALMLADYDGATMGNPGSYSSGHRYHCASDAANAPTSAILIPGCGTYLPVISASTAGTASTAYLQVAGLTGTAYVAVLATGAAAPDAVSIKAAIAGTGGVTATATMMLATGINSLALSGLMELTAYDVYMVIEEGGTLGGITQLDLTTLIRLPDLDDVTSAASLSTNDGQITPIVFVNNGGGALTGCSVAPGLPAGLDVAPTTDRSSCQIIGSPTEAIDETRFTVTATNAAGADATPATVSITVMVCSSTDVDVNDNGLIDICTLTQLHNIRYNLAGTSYDDEEADTSPGDAGITTGAPTSATADCDTAVGGVYLCGYELMNELDFDKDKDGSTWTRDGITGSIILDADDNDDTYFNTTEGGWVPIGDCGQDKSCYYSYRNDNQPFTAILEGNGHTINGLATHRNLHVVGLFGRTSRGAEIRNLGLTGNLAAISGTSGASIGGLVGNHSGGSIVASYTTGNAYGGAGNDDNVGGLVGTLLGYRDFGSITASYALGDVDGDAGHEDDVGGLVGEQYGGDIIASFAIGDVGGGAGNEDNVGGLVGFQYDGNITASYAIGDVDGGAGSIDEVGGLVGYHYYGSITASYATGRANGGADIHDRTGALIGRLWRFDRMGSIYASWGFGTTTGEYTGIDSSRTEWSSDRPTGVATAGQLTISNVPQIWNTATSNTLGAWDFGTNSQNPALKYSDYDGRTVGGASPTSGHRYHCANDQQNASTGAILIPDCGKLVPLFTITELGGTTASIKITATADRAYIAVLEKNSAAPSATAIKNAVTGENNVKAATSGPLLHGRGSLSLTGLAVGTTYDAYLVTESGTRLGLVTWFSLTTLAKPNLVNVSDVTLHVGGRSEAIFLINNGGASLISCSVIPSVLPDELVVSLTPSRASCQITGTPIAPSSQATYTVTATNSAGTATANVNITIKQPTCSSSNIDVNSNGLIDICTLVQLNNVRHNLAGTSYKTSSSDAGDSSGCPNSVCRGYELLDDLNFDKDGDGSTWRRDERTGAITLDAGDNANTYFNTSESGWESIGNCGPSNDCNYNFDNQSFTATFEGNGHTINGVATYRDLPAIGLFGITDGAEIRNLGLTGNLVAMSGTGEASVGGLVGYKIDGSIVASYTTGNSYGGAGNGNNVGGLVGYLVDNRGFGSITASYAIGDVDGGTGHGDNVGGLVGYQSHGNIIASYAIGNVDGGSGAGSHDNVGGLVGNQYGGSITASYASGDVNGGAGSVNEVGGLVGYHYYGSITASYATGRVYGGVGYNRTGALIGSLVALDRLGFIYVSWGFGTVNGGFPGISSSLTLGRKDRPTGVATASQLTISNVPSSWNAAARNTLDAWDFGTSSQNPALKYADYDGPTGISISGGDSYHCANDRQNAPVGAILIPNCGTLIPGQRSTGGSSGTSGASRSYAFPAPVRKAWHQPLHTAAAAEATLDLDCDQSGASSAGACGSQEGEGAVNGAVRVTLTPDAREVTNLIATFDDATHGPAAMRVNSATYELTGIFANPSLGNWNNFDGRPDSARVGAASVSTWQIGTLHDAQATGSIRIKGVVITGRYINFLMAGGGTTLDGSKASVGVTLYLAGSDTPLAVHSPSHCTDRYIKGDRHWAHIDVSDIEGMVVDIQIHDRDATSNCGFIAFDHFYQSGTSRGQQAATATRPVTTR